MRLVVPYVDRLIKGGAVAAWHKREGDRVDYGDDLVDLEASVRGVTLVRVTASDSGVVRRISASEGTERQEGELLALLSTEPDEPVDEAPAAVAASSVFRVVANIVDPGSGEDG
jgi:pyruvate/2-oxoglutarate dehydrogenase complex dihydrolipoamide acyltransferase (E2) component